VEYDSKLADIIASLPEVTGGFLYAPDRGIYSNQTGGVVKDESLQQISLKLTKIISMMSVHFHDTGGIRVCFRDMILFGTMIQEGHWLFLLHQPSLSPGMIKMTVQMALNIQTEESPEAEISAEPQEATENPQTNDNIMAILLSEESELRLPLENIHSQLAHYIGPVAELVFNDSVEIWASNNTPSLENLPELISMIQEEIDDEDDRNEFLNSLQSKKEE